jgi:hypothetical protein
VNATDVYYDNSVATTSPGYGLNVNLVNNLWNKEFGEPNEYTGNIFVSWGTNTVTNIVAVNSLTTTNSDITVDPVFGNDSTASVGGGAFKTLLLANQFAKGGEHWHFKLGTNDISGWVWGPTNALIDCDAGAVFESKDINVSIFMTAAGSEVINNGRIQNQIGWGFGGPCYNIWNGNTNLLSFNGTTIYSDHGDIQHGNSATNQLTILINNCQLYGGSWDLEFTGQSGSSNMNAYISNTTIHENSWNILPSSGVQNLRAVYSLWCNLHISGLTVIVNNTTTNSVAGLPNAIMIDVGTTAWVGPLVVDNSQSTNAYYYFSIATNANANAYYYGPALPTNVIYGKSPVYPLLQPQPANSNLTNWSLLGTNLLWSLPYAVAGTTNVTVWSVTNAFGYQPPTFLQSTQAVQTVLIQSNFPAAISATTNNALNALSQANGSALTNSHAGTLPSTANNGTNTLASEYDAAIIAANAAAAVTNSNVVIANPASIAAAGGITNAGIVVTVATNGTVGPTQISSWNYFVTNTTPRHLVGQINMVCTTTAILAYQQIFTVSWPAANAWSTNACIVTPSANNCNTNWALTTAGWAKMVAYNMTSNSFLIGTAAQAAGGSDTNNITFSVDLP